MDFLYKARTTSGEVVEDKITADSRKEALAELSRLGNSPLFLREVKGKRGEIHIPFIDRILGRIKLRDKLSMTKNLSGMLKAGLPLYRALGVLEHQTKKTEFKKVLRALMKAIQGGDSLGNAMEKYPKVFPPLMVAMVNAGEESGGLPEALDNVGVYLHKSYTLQKKVKGAMIYPTVILVAMFGIGIVMFIFVVPTLTKLFTEIDMPLPASTQFIVSLNDIVQQQPLLVALGLGAFIFGIVYFLKSPKMKKPLDWFVARVPVIKGLVKEINTARTARTLSSLLNAGVSLTRAIEITHEVVQHTAYKEILAQASKDITKGVPLSKVLKAGGDWYPIMAVEMVEVGEETGQLSEVLMDVALFYEEEVSNKTKDLSTIIEPVLMLIIGTGVGFFAVSMIKPMFSILDTL